MRKTLLSFALLLGFIGVLPVSAAGVIDQEYWPNYYSTVGLTDADDETGEIFRSLCGQEFVPSLSELVGVDLGLVRVNWTTSDPADVWVYIHEDTIDGEIVTSALVEDVLYSSDSFSCDNPLHINWGQAIELEVGRMYVIEIYEVEMDTFAWGLGGGGYPSGVAIQGGERLIGEYGNSCYLFRTYATPEPLTLSLLGVSALAMLRRRKESPPYQKQNGEPSRPAVFHFRGA